VWNRLQAKNSLPRMDMVQRLDLASEPTLDLC
jgi:hypothetical protein